jgi:hypothetical protein
LPPLLVPAGLYWHWQGPKGLTWSSVRGRG